ncbi:Rod shape-determining protein MreC [Hyella patelloides LEGE 07179]|uniref:Cell shape-determining protein MreC n=1 Tax=Hyella patelloides LEGE 07179 TaxID=945734 RepID=A0A563VXR0_9CYAN|nr:rod shape-determining protein MreC [Hyella patelloides]VEP16232.1 Rod shape-determining protein MreC [Hyella patelloides LEGE 07179]
MNRWQKRQNLKIVAGVAVLAIAWFLKYFQAAPIVEAHYLMSAPFQSQNQLKIEDRLTNARILELEQRITELEQQNKQFTELVKQVDTEQQSDVIAPIISRSVDSWWNQVTLGKGSNEGIEPGYIVLGIGGIVGRVVSVTDHTSRVLLISDPNSRVGVTVSRSRNLGYLRGKNSQTAVMQFFSKVTDVKEGDAIATSPLGNLYPHGMTIGRVISIDYDRGAAPEAEIQLTAPIDLLEWVVIRPFKPKLG